MAKHMIYELNAGDSYTEQKVIDRSCIDQFAAVSGDYSPIHMDEAYARTTKFGGCIAHGMLLCAYISKIIGMEFPGEGTIYAEQKVRFSAPVPVNTKVNICVEVEKTDLDRNRAYLRTVCGDEEGKILLEGEAVVLPPKK